MHLKEIFLMYDRSSLLVLHKEIKQCFKSTVIKHGFLGFCRILKMVGRWNSLAHVRLNESKDF